MRLAWSTLKGEQPLNKEDDQDTWMAYMRLARLKD